MTLNDKLRKLEGTLKEYGRMLVALSGGVDSAFLLAFARKTLGADGVAAATACGPHLAQDEVDYAKDLCEALGINHVVIPMDHVLPVIKHNPVDRCYLCKKEIFSTLKEYAEADDRVLADGTNLDDMEDYRPGHKALAELNVVSPLKEAGMTKDDIREALKILAEDGIPGDDNGSSITTLVSALTLENGMPLWEKPAFACLASRIPYGEEITADKLESIYRAEVFLRDLGFKQVRVRHHGELARIEVMAEDRSKFYDDDFMDNVNEGIKECGFKFVTLDLGGYKMGGGYNAR